MTQIRLYIDEDAMHHGLVAGLRARTIDVLTVLEAGHPSEDDEAQLEFAANEGRVLYSFNVGDFCRLHGESLAMGRMHAGIIVMARQRYTVGEQLRRLLILIATHSAEEMRDRLEFL
jgi:hypothetical protein